MPLTERDPNISGRTSRTSTTSAGSRGFTKSHGVKHDIVPGGAGVMSMLKTSTELGDLGAYSSNSRLPPMPVNHRNRRNAPSRLSTSSGSSLQRKPSSRHRAWPSTSSTRRSANGGSSATSYPFDTQSPGMASPYDVIAMLPPAQLSNSNRSYSMTHTEPPFTLSNQPSFSSLRSHGTASRPRSPFRYPTRLKRLGYRPGSPALSDVTTSYSRQPPGSVILTNYARPKGPYAIKQYPTASNDRTALPFSDMYKHSPVSSAVSAEPHRDDTFEPGPHVVEMTPLSSNLTAFEHYAALTATSSPDKFSSDVPSSSVPPTPKDNTSLQVLLSPSEIGLIDSDIDDTPKLGSQAGPIYYDYTEQYDHAKTPEPIQEQEVGPAKPVHIPFGFVHRIKTILEERVTSRYSTVTANPDEIAELPGSPVEVVELPAEDVQRPVELPGEPVVKRITRELIVSALHSSDQGDDTSASISTEVKKYITQNNESVASESTSDVAAAASSVGAVSEKRHSTMSEASTTHSAFTAPETVLDCRQASLRKASNYSTGLARSPSTRDDVNGSLFDRLQAPSVEPGFEEVVIQPPAHTSTTNDALASSDGQFRYPSAPQDLNVDFQNPTSATHTKVTVCIAPPSPIEDFSNGSFAPRPRDRDEQSAPNALGFAPDHKVPPLPGAIQYPSVDPPPAVHFRNSSPIPGFSSPQRLSDLGTLNPTWAHRKQFAVSTYSVDSILGNCNFGTDSAIDTRLGALKYPGSCLPDVEEVSHEGSSVNESRPTSFKFPRSQKLTVRSSLDELRRSGRMSALSEPIRGSMQEAVDNGMIPSLNFSSFDLISKMNEELEVRSLRSMDGMSEFHYRDFLMLGPTRPKSSRTIRERYKSFFASLEEMGHSLTEATGRPSIGLSASLRSYSPEDVMDEVQRLSIPTVGGLAHRISELLPSLKRHSTVDDAEKMVCADGQDDNFIEGDRTIHEERSSRRLRPLPGRSGLVVLDDDVFERMTQQVNETGVTDSSFHAERDTSQLYERQPTPVAELEAPMPAFLRVETPPPIFEGDGNLELSIRRSMAKLSSRSPGDRRPWNHDKYYTWSVSNPALNIALPQPTLQRSRSPLAIPRLQPVLSEPSMNASVLHEEFLPTNSEFLSSADEGDLESDSEMFRPAKWSIFGCLRRKVGLSNDPEAAPKAVYLPQDTSHDIQAAVFPGDRYPTTGLTPPSTFNIDEVRSFFSDDSSQSRMGKTFRKRFTSLRARIPPSRAGSALANRQARQVDGCDTNLVGEVTQPRGEAWHDVERADSCDATGGMGRAEFRARTVVEKIKRLWYRAGQIVRSLATQQTRPHSQSQDTTVNDSVLYTGT